MGLLWRAEFGVQEIAFAFHFPYHCCSFACPYRCLACPFHRRILPYRPYFVVVVVVAAAASSLDLSEHLLLLLLLLLASSSGVVAAVVASASFVVASSFAVASSSVGSFAQPSVDSSVLQQQPSFVHSFEAFVVVAAEVVLPFGSYHPFGSYRAYSSVAFVVRSSSVAFVAGLAFAVDPYCPSCSCRPSYFLLVVVLLEC
mmetsp:Transcript_16221/g.23545  ORF Transcript_16221/g.23545 Transcript_16221/m.23545 type:complete len:200 (+) Transcript_16221:1015-1614(+)